MPSVRNRRRVWGENRLLEADLVADLVAEAPALFLGDPRRGGPRGDPSRLEHDHGRVIGWKQPRLKDGRRHPRRLARAGRRHQRPGSAPASPSMIRGRLASIGSSIMGCSYRGAVHAHAWLATLDHTVFTGTRRPCTNL